VTSPYHRLRAQYDAALTELEMARDGERRRREKVLALVRSYAESKYTTEARRLVLENLKREIEIVYEDAGLCGGEKEGGE